MPTLHELSALFDLLPELPPPLPRPRRQAYGTKSTAPTQATSTPAAEPPPTLLQRLCPFLFSLSKPSQGLQRKINPFAALKQGKKIIVIATVGNGNISFFRFSQGAFEEWPMI
jgi:tRNA-splicing endonuclease subunit Sen54